MSKKMAVINQNKDFRTLYFRGRSQVSSYMVTYVRANKRGRCRVGITTGKKIGKAVQRNRCRRLIREAYRLISPAIQGNWDIVFVARARMCGANMHQVKKDMQKQFRSLSLLQQRPSHKGKADENASH